MKRSNITSILTFCILVVLFVAGCAKQRGDVFYEKGQYYKAISDYNKAIEINPRDAKAYNNRGNAYQRKGQYDQAISDYNKALEINPRFAMAYSIYSSVLFKLVNIT